MNPFFMLNSNLRNSQIILTEIHCIISISFAFSIIIIFLFSHYIELSTRLLCLILQDWNVISNNVMVNYDGNSWYIYLTRKSFSHAIAYSFLLMAIFCNKNLKRDDIEDLVIRMQYTTNQMTIQNFIVGFDRIFILQ